MKMNSWLCSRFAENEHCVLDWLKMNIDCVRDLMKMNWLCSRFDENEQLAMNLSCGLACCVWLHCTALLYITSLPHLGRFPLSAPSPQQVPSTSVYSLNGYGYATRPITTFNYRADRFVITLEFKTFWDNSRLLFGGNPKVRPWVVKKLQSLIYNHMQKQKKAQ